MLEKALGLTWKLLVRGVQPGITTAAHWLVNSLEPITAFFQGVVGTQKFFVQLSDGAIELLLRGVPNTTPLDFFI